MSDKLNLKFDEFKKLVGDLINGPLKKPYYDNFERRCNDPESDINKLIRSYETNSKTSESFKENDIRYVLHKLQFRFVESKEKFSSFLEPTPEKSIIMSSRELEQLLPDIPQEESDDCWDVLINPDREEERQNMLIEEEKFLELGHFYMSQSEFRYLLSEGKEDMLHNMYMLSRIKEIPLKLYITHYDKSATADEWKKNLNNVELQCEREIEILENSRRSESSNLATWDKVDDEEEIRYKSEKINMEIQIVKLKIAREKLRFERTKTYLGRQKNLLDNFIRDISMANSNKENRDVEAIKRIQEIKDKKEAKRREIEEEEERQRIVEENERLKLAEEERARKNEEYDTLKRYVHGQMAAFNRARDEEIRRTIQMTLGPAMQMLMNLEKERQMELSFSMSMMQGLQEESHTYNPPEYADGEAPSFIPTE